MFDDVQSVMDSWLPDTNVCVNAVQTQAERLLSLDPQPPPYNAQPEHSLETPVKELRQEPEATTVAIPSIVYATGKEATNRIVEVAVVKKTTIYVPKYPGIGRTSVRPATKDPTPTRTIAESGIVRRK